MNSICVENKGGRNGARGPSYQQADMRFGYRFRKGASQTFDVNFELYNLANTANFDNPTGDIRSTDFLRPDGASRRQRPAARGAVQRAVGVLIFEAVTGSRTRWT